MNTVLVEEILSKEQVKELLDMANVHSTKWQLDDHLLINKGWFESWTGERYDGYIVCHCNGSNTDKYKYYFMEVTKDLVRMSLEEGYLYKPTYHALLPISNPHKDKVCLPRSGNMKDVVNYIISNTVDKWGYYEVPMSKKEIEDCKRNGLWLYKNTKLVPLEYCNLNWINEPLTDTDKAKLLKEKKARENELLSIFRNSLPPAEDDAWYNVLCQPIEAEVIRILRSRGYSVRIDGERDSFGWVTRGIVVNGSLMCLY